MSNEELLSKFSDYLDVVFDMDLNANINEILAAANTDRGHDVARCHNYVLQAHSLRFRPDAFPLHPERTKQKALVAVESYAASHPLEGMRRKDYCSCTRERSFERAALGAFFGYLQILSATTGSELIRRAIDAYLKAQKG